jgi:hypothetical protein
MLCSFRVACPHAGCGWTGSLVPSVLKDGEDSEIVPGQRAWLQCPRCNRDWEVRIKDDKATVLPLPEGGGEPPSQRM